MCGGALRRSTLRRSTLRRSTLRRGCCQGRARLIGWRYPAQGEGEGLPLQLQPDRCVIAQGLPRRAWTGQKEQDRLRQGAEAIEAGDGSSHIQGRRAIGWIGAPIKNHQRKCLPSQQNVCRFEGAGQIGGTQQQQPLQDDPLLAGRGRVEGLGCIDPGHGHALLSTRRGQFEAQAGLSSRNGTRQLRNSSPRKALARQKPIQRCQTGGEA